MTQRTPHSRVIDGTNRFARNGIEYKVTIEVKVCMAFIWAVIKCIFKRQDMRITHEFTNNPFDLNNDEGPTA